MSQRKSTEGQRVATPSVANARNLLPEWLEFSAAFGRSRDLDNQIWYALPTVLVENIQSEAADILDAAEWNFEYALAALSHRFFSVGFENSRPIQYQLLVGKDPPIMTEHITRWMGWHTLWSPDKAEQLLKLGQRGIDPFRTQQAAFAGWLMTHPLFLHEVRELRDHETQSAPSNEIGPKHVFSEEVRQFCCKWHLAEMTTWDLPFPQGPNISTAPFPSTLVVSDDDTHVHIPATMSVPARNNMRKLITEMRRSETPPHLAEWQAILDRKSDERLGVKRFAEILPLHFYRNIVLGRRYPDRIAGHNQAIDHAFARWSHAGVDSIEDLRHGIERRLKSAD